MTLAEQIRMRARNHAKAERVAAERGEAACAILLRDEAADLHRIADAVEQLEQIHARAKPIAINFPPEQLGGSH